MYNERARELMYVTRRARNAFELLEFLFATNPNVRGGRRVHTPVHMCEATFTACAHKTHTRTHTLGHTQPGCLLKEAATVATAELVEMLTHHEFQSCSQMVVRI